MTECSCRRAQNRVGGNFLQQKKELGRKEKVKTRKDGENKWKEREREGEKQKEKEREREIMTWKITRPHSYGSIDGSIFFFCLFDYLLTCIFFRRPWSNLLFSSKI